jgi:hypothetical protein
MKLSRTNLFQTALTTTVEILESLLWIGLGFIPSLAALEIGYRLGLRRKGITKYAPKKSSYDTIEEMNVW